MSTNCYGTINSGRNLIRSPNYPDEYPQELNCTWELKVPLGKRILLHFDKFDTYEKFDYLIVYDGPQNEDKILASLSGKILKDIQSTSSKLSLRFATAKKNEIFTGFQIRYDGKKISLFF